LLLVGGAVVGLALASGCSTQTKRQWLTLFFDGVPPEKTNRLATATGTALNDTNASTAQARSVALVLQMHPPYAEGKCIACHESKYSQKMRVNLGDTCLGCHKDLLVAGKSWHAPAASGECMVCHEPHQSNRKFLLAQPADLLCAQCHAAGEMATVAAHQEKGINDCTTCHDPHQSGSKFLLKPKAGTTGSFNASEAGRERTSPAVVPSAAILPPPALTLTNGLAASASDRPNK
jgi:predicted CXXCH cytochrome family protein